MIDIVNLSFDDRLVSLLREALDSTLQDVFQLETQTEAWSVDQATIIQPLGSLEACRIDIRQEDILCGAFIAAFSREIVLKVMQQYGSDLQNEQKMIDDAVGEMANMIYGAFKTEINKIGYHLAMDVPFTLDRSEPLLDDYKGAEKLIFPFWADGHKGKIIITQTR